jgi:WW domain
VYRCICVMHNTRKRPSQAGLGPRVEKESASRCLHLKKQTDLCPFLSVVDSPLSEMSLRCSDPWLVCAAVSFAPQQQKKKRAMAPQAQRVLSDGWIAQEDQLGRTYYWHILSHRSQWEYPFSAASEGEGEGEGEDVYNLSPGGEDASSPLPPPQLPETQQQQGNSEPPRMEEWDSPLSPRQSHESPDSTDAEPAQQQQQQPDMREREPETQGEDLPPVNPQEKISSERVPAEKVDSPGGFKGVDEPVDLSDDVMSSPPPLSDTSPDSDDLLQGKKTQAQDKGLDAVSLVSPSSDIQSPEQHPKPKPKPIPVQRKGGLSGPRFKHVASPLRKRKLEKVSKKKKTKSEIRGPRGFKRVTAPKSNLSPPSGHKKAGQEPPLKRAKKDKDKEKKDKSSNPRPAFVVPRGPKAKKASKSLPLPPGWRLEIRTRITGYVCFCSFVCIRLNPKLTPFATLLF